MKPRPSYDAVWHTEKKIDLMFTNWQMTHTFSHTWEDQILQETYTWLGWQHPLHPLLQAYLLTDFPPRLAWYLWIASRCKLKFESIWVFFVLFFLQDMVRNCLWTEVLHSIICMRVDHGQWINAHFLLWPWAVKDDCLLHRNRNTMLR